MYGWVLYVYKWGKQQNDQTKRLWDSVTRQEVTALKEAYTGATALT